MEEAHQTLAEAITYQIDGVDKDPIYVKITPCNFNSYKEITKKDRTIKFEMTTWSTSHLVESKPEYRYDTFAGYAATQDKLNMKFMNSDCRKNKMNTKLKRLLR